jgi:hypothetical protein
MKIDQIRYVNLINFITKHWLIETQKNRSSVMFVLRSSLLSSTNLYVHWSVLIHLYDDDTVQVSILYKCSLLIETNTRFRLLSSRWSISKKCESRDPHYFYLVRLPSIYLVGKTFRSYSMFSSSSSSTKLCHSSTSDFFSCVLLRVRCLRHWWTSMEWNIKGCKDVDY